MSIFHVFWKLGSGMDFLLTMCFPNAHRLGKALKLHNHAPFVFWITGWYFSSLSVMPKPQKICMIFLWYNELNLLIIIRKDKSPFWNFLHISPVRDASGKVYLLSYSWAIIWLTAWFGCVIWPLFSSFSICNLLLNVILALANVNWSWEQRMFDVFIHRRVLIVFVWQLGDYLSLWAAFKVQISDCMLTLISLATRVLNIMETTGRCLLIFSFHISKHRVSQKPIG